MKYDRLLEFKMNKAYITSDMTLNFDQHQIYLFNWTPLEYINCDEYIVKGLHTHHIYIYKHCKLKMKRFPIFFAQVL